MRPGGYTKAVELARAEQQRIGEVRAQAKRERDRLRREAAERERQAARSHRLRSKRGLAPKDHDARNRRNRARYSGKDGQAGRVLRQMDGRLRQAQERLEDVHVKKDHRLGIDLRGRRARRDVLFRVPGGALPLGRGRRLMFGELSMAPGDRVALTGPNGAGKSTLVRHIAAHLPLPADKVVYVAQEIDRSEAGRVMGRVRGLSKARLGEVLSVVSCLGSRPERLMETDDPSPGEVRKLILALGMARAPHLIIMDEPTNHLDLPSIECLENALADCPAGLLLVSHDLRFLQRLTRTRWQIGPDEGDPAGSRMSLAVRLDPWRPRGAGRLRPRPPDQG
jgi:ATPase subunit of ABC transporter with duplicated ATPase domains